MKKRIFALILAAMMLMPMLIACDEDPSPMAAEKDFTVSVGDFSIEMLKRTLDNSDENAILSPLSVMMVLTMLENGAEEKSLLEMEEVFGLTREKANEFLGKYLSSLPKGDLIKIANSIWIKDDYEVKETFIEKNRVTFSAECFEKPFDSTTKDEINKWIENNTDKMIKNMLDKIPEEAVMYLVNTILFDGKWVEEYKKDRLVKREFTTAFGEKKQTDTMLLEPEKYFEYKEALGFTRDYKGERYTFVAILPKEGQLLTDYLASVDFSELAEKIKNQEGRGAVATLPTFTYESKATLNDMLKDMGMKTVFDAYDPEKNLTGISDDPGLYVSRVIHAAKIELTNEGTKAAGATIVENKSESAVMPNAEIILNRPFIYMIYDTVTEIPVFVGAATDIGE